jgi:hypothetical protein
MSFLRVSCLAICVAGVGLMGCGDSPRANRGDSRSTAPAAKPASEPPVGAAAPAPANSNPAPDAVPIQIQAVIGGKKALARGLGQCNHTEDASIYQAPATLWRAGFQAASGGDLQDLNLTVWQPKTGGDQFTVALRVGGQDHHIATVKGGTLVGTGTATIRSDGPAGTLMVEGKDGNGVPLTIRVRCDRFTEPVAEGG